MAKTTGGNAANAQGMLTNVTAPVNQNADTVLHNVKTLAEAHHKSSVMLVAGICQFMLVRAYHADDQQRWPMDRTRDYLKTQLNERGLKAAMVYRYIATGQKLGQAIVKPGIGAPMMSAFFNADNENKAHGVIMRIITENQYIPATEKPKLDWLLDGEQKPRLSLDVLRVNLSLDALDLTKQPGYKAPVGDGLSSGPATPTVPATKAKPASIIARLTADKDVVKLIPENVVTAACDVIGRERMAERLVSLMTADECAKVLQAVNTRLQVLAEAPKEEPKEGEPVEQPAPQEMTRRSRPRKRKAA